jgi:hypothetical protein
MIVHYSAAVVETMPGGSVVVDPCLTREPVRCSFERSGTVLSQAEFDRYGEQCVIFTVHKTKRTIPWVVTTTLYR